MQAVTKDDGEKWGVTVSMRAGVVGYGFWS